LDGELDGEDVLARLVSFEVVVAGALRDEGGGIEIDAVRAVAGLTRDDPLAVLLGDLAKGRDREPSLTPEFFGAGLGFGCGGIAGWNDGIGDGHGQTPPL
jgi:hypothetical protein